MGGGGAVSSISVEDDINPNGLLALQLLRTLRQSSDQKSVELAIDLAAFCRTLVVLTRRLQYGYVFNLSDSQTIKDQLQAMNSSFATGGQTESQLEPNLDRITTVMNRMIASSKYIFAEPAYHLHYPWGDIVQRISDMNKYDLRSNCVLETDSELEDRVSMERAKWEAIQRTGLSVYEHVGRLDGGERMYDPFFLSRVPEQAQEFFTPGRVFAMLWSTEGYGLISEGIAHYDYSIQIERSAMMVHEGAYTGPFEGPTTARYLVVVQGGPFSSLCLSIVTVPYPNPNPRRYVRISMASLEHQSFGSVQIQIIAKPHYEPGPKRSLEPYPPHLIPSSDLPLACSENVAAGFSNEFTGQKGSTQPNTNDAETQLIKQLMDRKFYIDLKRIIEVESGIKVKNVGLVSDSAAWRQIGNIFTASST